MKVSFSLQIPWKPSQKCSANVKMEWSKTIRFRLHKQAHSISHYIGTYNHKHNCQMCQADTGTKNLSYCFNITQCCIMVSWLAHQTWHQEALCLTPSSSTFMQWLQVSCSHTHVPISPNSIIWCWAKSDILCSWGGSDGQIPYHISLSNLKSFST